MPLFSANGACEHNSVERNRGFPYKGVRQPDEKTPCQTHKWPYLPEGAHRCRFILDVLHSPLLN
jgi:hypothetical protein